MRLMPLTLSAHASTLWTTPDSFQEPNLLVDEPCGFCGQVSGRWQERFHLDDDHTNNAPENVVAACPLCHLAQHLERPRIHEEAALIWLPEMSQRALIALVRTLHLALRAAGERVDAEVASSGRSGTSAHLYRAHQELLARTTPAKARLGTSSPRTLGAALRALPAAAYARRDQLLGGLRLLPLGRLYHGDQDVYPEVLATWAQLGAASRSGR
jgi:intracellular multiplication protein IcmJ